jgi:pimeloyl-ACP methyl ester carboxylesterase
MSPVTGKGVTVAASYAELPNGLVSGANGVDYAYRDTGPTAGGVPLVLFQHFRGNLDSWDPALIDALAASRRVITFDNQQAMQRMYARTGDRDVATNWATRQAQYDAVCTWGIPDHALLQRLSALDMPVFVANGDSDPMILPHYSYLLAGLIPQARVKIYPDAAHGFLFQHHAEFAADVETFLR